MSYLLMLDFMLLFCFAGQILVFYAFYYAFLAGLFAISITIVLSTLDPYVPRFQTRLQAPGMSRNGLWMVALLLGYV